MNNHHFNRHKTFLVGLLLTTAFLVSCKKFIAIPDDPNKLEQSILFADSASAMTAVAGTYTYSTYNEGFFAFNNANFTIYPGLSADEIYSGNNEANAMQFYNNALLPDNYNIGTMWKAPYSGLYPVNAIISSVATSPGLSGTFKTQITGEMKLQRALYYFYLVNYFGAVPLVTSTDYKATSKLGRTSIDSVYTQILADINDARQALPAAYPSAGRARPNLYTAMAFLARVQLYRENWQAAFDASNAVINSGVYTLESDLNNVFLRGSNEAIWQLPANFNNSNWQVKEALNFIPYFPGLIPQFPLTPVLANAFESNDERKVKWVAATDVALGGTTQTFYYPYKYKNRDYSNPTEEDYMIFRLGEQYLIRAEAAAHLNKITTALADVNVIRTRAGLTPATATTQTDVLEAIMHERQIELFCEWGNRWLDLKRTNTAGSVLGQIKPSWKPYGILYPIPNAQRSLNYRLTQNPGYQ